MPMHVSEVSGSLVGFEVSNEDPRRYNRQDYSDDSRAIDQAEVYIDNDAERLRSVVPTIVANGDIAAIEFIELSRWQSREAPDGRRLRGCLLWTKDGRVALWYKGTSLEDNKPDSVSRFILKSFGMPDDALEKTRLEAWPTVEYSVVVHLTT